MKEFEALVLDLDDTLFDLAAAKAKAHALLPVMGISVMEFRAIEQKWWDRFGDGVCSYDELRRGRWLDAGLSDHSISDIDEQYVSLSDDVRLKAGARQLLKSLRNDGLKLGVLTNAPGPTQRAKMIQCGIINEFDAIGICDEIGFGKPHPQAYLAIAHALGVSLARCAMVGDDLEKDVIAPLRAGMRSAVWLSRENNFIPTLGDPRIRIANSLSDVRMALGIDRNINELSA